MPIHFEVYLEDGRWRWKLVSMNGRTLAKSGESFWSRFECLGAVGLVASTNRFTPVIAD